MMPSNAQRAIFENAILEKGKHFFGAFYVGQLNQCDVLRLKEKFSVQLRIAVCEQKG